MKIKWIGKSFGPGIAAGMNNNLVNAATGADASYIPMMRTTGLAIDQAGNVWTANNWKPDFDVDIKSNPGGDGMVIFVGLANQRISTVRLTD